LHDDYFKIYFFFRFSLLDIRKAMKSLKGYNFRADLFSYGRTVMEMTTGKAPSVNYRNANEIVAISFCARSCQLHIRLPSNTSVELVNLIVGLTRVHAHCRLGSRNINELKQHEFFATIQFDNVRGTLPATLSRHSQPLYSNNSDSSEGIEAYECSDPLGCARS
jgi:hypothetical protein